MERVALAEAAFGQVPVLLNAGDTLFFHCNLLHASPQNKSDGPRWSIITAYAIRRVNPDRHLSSFMMLSLDNGQCATKSSAPIEYCDAESSAQSRVPSKG